MMFLEDLALSAADSAALGGVLGGLFAMLAAFMILFFLIGIGLYIYVSLAFMAIARKAKYSTPGIAWIPGIGPLIIEYKVSKMHWWPWLLLIGYLFMVIPVLGFLASLALLVFAVFSVIWMWKMFEAVNRPGWWAILSLIPVVNLILLGIAAWSE
ncbi:MAG: hypothetical protein KKB21_01540 [Nanoarchaeota archaeon]|nr:hypothetical protein [Nanoarchaeota archaeon]MBU4086239.1 hypothetical protein [Nanoarchaeota archaeon]